MGWKSKSMGWIDEAAAWTHENNAKRRTNMGVRISCLPNSAQGPRPLCHPLTPIHNMKSPAFRHIVLDHPAAVAAPAAGSRPPEP